MMDLFEEEHRIIHFAPGAVLLGGFAIPAEEALLRAITDVVDQAPLRQMTTPGGHVMSVAMTNCGQYGWISDRRGYRYGTHDPLSGKPWPAMPEAFMALAQSAAATAAGYTGFTPDACLINRYLPGTKLTLHQDKDELDYRAPIVSVSLGIPATFLFGGLNRTDKTQKLRLTHGDVVVWGGESRLAFHGISPLKESTHPLLGATRINLTFRTTH